VEVSQQKADQDEDARESPEDHFHNIMYLLCLSCHCQQAKARFSIGLTDADYQAHTRCDNQAAKYS
jgi:hypothetical protein